MYILADDFSSFSLTVANLLFLGDYYLD